MMKKIFRINSLFLFEFRIGVLIFISPLPLGLWFIQSSFLGIEDWIIVLFAGIVFCVLFCLGLKYVLIPTVWPCAFGKLVITDVGIEYRCLFKKPSYISWSDCEFCGIESYRSDIADLYGTGRRYVYFSTKPIPPDRRNKLDMMKNDNELIKFFPVTKKLCDEILRHKSASDIRRAFFQNEIKW